MATNNSEFFEFRSPEDFFRSIREELDRYKIDRSMPTLMYIVMGLNHLHEWIKNNYDPSHPYYVDAIKFSKRLKKNDTNHNVIRKLCNHEKHIDKQQQTDTTFGTNMGAWPNLASVHNLAQGATLDHTVDGVDVADVCDALVLTYEREWFKVHP